MKNLRILGLILLCAMLTGCMKYRVTLTNGTHFTVLGKPKYDESKSVYRYKSGGEERTISAGQVSSIEPSSESDEWQSPGAGGNTGSSYWEK